MVPEQGKGRLAEKPVKLIWPPFDMGESPESVRKLPDGNWAYKDKPKDEASERERDEADQNKD